MLIGHQRRRRKGEDARGQPTNRSTTAMGALFLLKDKETIAAFLLALALFSLCRDVMPLPKTTLEEKSCIRKR